VILGTNEPTTLAAYDERTGRLVLVCDNNTTQDRTVRYDLSRFSHLGGPAAVYRTSASEDRARVADVPLANKELATTARAQSITTYVIGP
jgi:hypothetical protein